MLIDAQSNKIFKIPADVENWNLWLRAPTFDMGRRAKVFQPKLLPVILRVTEIVRNRVFTWGKI